jgi:rare lipoprotein A
MTLIANQFKKIILIVCAAIMAGCTPLPEKPTSIPESDSDRIQKGRYAQETDGGPMDHIDLSHIPDAIPKKETRTIAGNKNPYTILGKTYHLIKDESSYKERGYASWYGQKFNGYKTSNGEIYDMYAMTAAHKTLPIPSYVRVTNVTNGKTVVVRVNDRGPFHEGRIIDLSYAAAQRIGIHQHGTGLVDVEIVLPDDKPAIPRRADTQTNIQAVNAQTVNTQAVNTQAVNTQEIKLPENTYLQLAAFSTLDAAKEYSAKIAAQLAMIPVIHSDLAPKEIHRVRLGPFKTTQAVQAARDQLAKLNVFDVHLVYLK